MPSDQQQPLSRVRLGYHLLTVLMFITVAECIFAAGALLLALHLPEVPPSDWWWIIGGLAVPAFLIPQAARKRQYFAEWVADLQIQREE